MVLKDKRLADRMPTVRTTKGHIMPWDRGTIMRSLLRETALAMDFLVTPTISRGELLSGCRWMEPRQEEGVPAEIQDGHRIIGSHGHSGMCPAQIYNFVTNFTFSGSK
jgi:hypothetical protein